MGKTYDLMIRARGDSRDAERAMKQLSRSVAKTGKKISSVGSGMTMALTAPLVGLGVMGARELGAIEKSTKQTDITLRRFGDGAKISAGFVADLAKALQRKSGLDDQAIQSGQNMLLTLGSIDVKTKSGAKTFKIASRSMVEFADSMGKDVTTAGALYAKTLAAASQGSILLPKGVKLSGDAMAKLEADMKKASTSTERQTLVMDALQKKFAGGMDLTNSEKMAVAMDELAGVGAKIVTLLLPAFNVLVDKLQGVTTWFDGLSESGQKFVGIGLLVSAALGPVLVGVGTLVTLFAGPLAAALAAITGPVALGVAAVVGLGVAFTMAYRKSESFRSGVNSVLRSVKTNFTQIFGSLRQTLSTWIGWATTAWGKWGDDLVRAVRPAFNFVKAIVSTVLNSIASIIKVGLAVMRGDWSTAWAEFKSGAKKAWDGIKSIISSGARAAVQVVKNLANAIGKVASEMLSAGKKLGQKIIDGIISAIKGAAGRIKGAVKDAVGNIKIDIPKIDMPSFGGGGKKSRSGKRSRSANGRETFSSGTAETDSLLSSGDNYSNSGIDLFGNVLKPTYESVTNYFTASTSKPYSVKQNDNGTQSLVTNNLAKSFLEARKAKAEAELKAKVSERASKVARIGVLTNEINALVKSMKNKKISSVARLKLGKTRIAKVKEREDLRQDVAILSDEILSLGGSIQQDTESLIAPDIDTVADPTSTTTSVSGGDSTTSALTTSPGADAAISQLQNSLASSQANLQASNEAFGYFNGTGDIGYGGGSNALQSARGGLNIYFSSTVPYTQEQARLVAQMAAQGISANGQLANINTNTIQIGA